MLISFKSGLTGTSGTRSGHVAGHCDPATLIHKLGHHTCLNGNSEPDKRSADRCSAVCLVSALSGGAGFRTSHLPSTGPGARGPVTAPGQL